MKLFHLMVGIALLAYSVFNLPKFGIGEILVCSTFFPTLIITWFVFKKDVTGMLLAGMLIGLCIEFITEAYWNYSLIVYLYKDISLFVIMGWGYSFTLYLLLSGWLFRFIVRSKNVYAHDLRLLLMDIFIGPIWFLSNELLGMKGLHLWTYSECAGWTHPIPWLWGYPLEGVIGAIFLSTVMPSFVRYWAQPLSVSGLIDHRAPAPFPKGAK